MGLSRAEKYRALSEGQRREYVARLGEERARAAMKQWHWWGRPEQFAPGTKDAAISRKDWDYWLILAGRGYGKTRAGAEWVIERAREPGLHIALAGPTSDDVRKTMLSAGLEEMKGASGILAVSPPDFMPQYEPSKRMLTWPNGTVGTLYSAEEPERFRGPQHHVAWADELAAWKYPESWDQLKFGLRLGSQPQACITTTPKPKPMIKELIKDPRTVVVTGSTYENRVNLAQAFFNSIIRKYEGTRLGRQELWAELLEDIPGALWNIGMIEDLRVAEAPELLRVVVAIDPAVTSTATSDLTGIVAAGLGNNGHGYVLADRSGKYTPHEWALTAITLYGAISADRIVAEVNNGGDLVEVNLRTVDQSIPYRKIHASHGKRIRAEPVASLYEQGRVHHVGKATHFAALEDEMTTWDPFDSKAKSPNRLDGLVWAITDLMLGEAMASWSFGNGLEEFDDFMRGQSDSNREGMPVPHVARNAQMMKDVVAESEKEGFDPFGLAEYGDGKCPEYPPVGR